jgi:predicted transport protein
MISRKLAVRLDELNFDNLRVVLVAPSFDSKVVDATRMVAPHVKLVTFTVRKTSEGRELSATTLYDSEARIESSSHDVSSIDSHFTGRYKLMRPAFEKLCREIKTRLNVLPLSRKEFIAFKRNAVFADIHVYTDRLEVGLPLPEGVTVPRSFLKSPVGRFGPRINHFVRLQSPRDVDEDLMSAIAQAYRIS